jgi:glycosyltransferase involved in cell wall biosynthesis
VPRTRLLFLIGDYGTGGKERQLTEIIKGLSRERYEIHLFVKRNSSFYLDSIEGHLASYHSLEKENFSILDILVFRQCNNSIQPHVVFSFSKTLSHFALLLRLLGGFHYRLINGTIRDAPFRLNFIHRIEKALYNLYTEVVANSLAGLIAYNQRDKKGRYILYNGFDQRRTPENSKIELRKQLGIDDKFTVTMVASMGDSKDQTAFIKAAANVLKVTDDIQFYLIGDGPKKSEYLTLVSSLRLEKDVFFLGIVKNVEEYLKGSDLSVLMSTNAEGFPNVVLESLACGTPMIASQDGGIGELVINGENGYLVNKGDFEMLSNRIEYLYKNSEILEMLSYNAEKLARNNFSIDGMIRTFEEILDNRNFYIN